MNRLICKIFAFLSVTLFVSSSIAQNPTESQVVDTHLQNCNAGDSAACEALSNAYSNGLLSLKADFNKALVFEAKACATQATGACPSSMTSAAFLTNGTSALRAGVIESLDSRERGKRCCIRGPFLEIGSRFRILKSISESISVPSGITSTSATYLLGETSSTRQGVSDNPEPETDWIWFAVIITLLPAVGLFTKLNIDWKGMKWKPRIGYIMVLGLLFSLGIFFVAWAAAESTHFTTLWIDNAGEAPVGVSIGDEFRVKLPPKSHCRLTVRLEPLSKFVPTRGEVEVILGLRPLDGENRIERLLLENKKSYLFNFDLLNQYSLKAVYYD